MRVWVLSDSNNPTRWRITSRTGHGIAFKNSSSRSTPSKRCRARIRWLLSLEVEIQFITSQGLLLKTSVGQLSVSIPRHDTSNGLDVSQNSLNCGCSGTIGCTRIANLNLWAFSWYHACILPRTGQDSVSKTSVPIGHYCFHRKYYGKVKRGKSYFVKMKRTHL